MPETNAFDTEPETQLAPQSAPPSDSAMSIAISKAPVIARIFTSLILTTSRDKHFPIAFGKQS